MMRHARECPAVLFVLAITLHLPGCAADSPPLPGGSPARTNVVLLIGDGMGFEQVRAAGIWAHGREGTLSFEQLPHQGRVTTQAALGETTDSAAAATAMATGTKVGVGVISVEIPGSGRDLPTVLEHARSMGKSTGLVTTTFIAHATPAAFAAHTVNRGRFEEIVQDYLTGSRPNLLFGGARYMTSDLARAAGYVVVSDLAEMSRLEAQTADFVSGQFGVGNMPYEVDGLGPLPHLSEMTATALAILGRDPEGFFLMVEGGRIDHAGHSNSIERVIGETIEFSNAARVVVDWATGRDDTLIIVTADHETGGLEVQGNNGRMALPTVSWSTTTHTSQQVPVYAWGAHASSVLEISDNTEIYEVVMRHMR